MVKKVFSTILTIFILFQLCLFGVFYFYYGNMPKSMDELITYKLSDDYELVDKLTWRDKGDIVVQRNFSDDDCGYFTIRILSYKKHPTYPASYKKIHVDDYESCMYDIYHVYVDDHMFYYGSMSSDDAPDMVLKSYVKDGDYVYEFSMTNFDEQITKQQKKEFKKFLKSVRFLN